ncbi:MAG: KpsF/GutQ family sugar-phosphate isomerase [Elusimicrobia bacterium]|nr:KpsF/GutQ family sugar-phosphate isomerase [Elusimicrobiota bacterium]
MAISRQKKINQYLNRAKQVLRIEAEVLANMAKNLNSDFEKSIEMLSECKGRVAVIGIGKSGLVGRKVAATLSSTGTPALFLHPVECLHGDLGMLASGDVILALSYSGQTEEIKRLLPFIRKKGLKIIAITGRPHSPLAKEADLVIPLHVRREACPYNITPTASTTAMLAMGDALAISLMEKNGFKKEDFVRLHPGGMLGKMLSLKVKDIMRKGKENPIMDAGETVRKALFIMTNTRVGATSVINAQGKLIGFFTDGDLRRLLQKDPNLLNRRLSEVMTKHPICAHPEDLATKAATTLEKYNIDNLPVVDPKSMKPIGIIDERDLLAEGLK